MRYYWRSERLLRAILDRLDEGLSLLEEMRDLLREVADERGRGEGS